MLDERSFVNAVVALLASGGSTNHTIHLIAMARAAGIIIDWTDFDELSRAVRCLRAFIQTAKRTSITFMRLGARAISSVN